MGNNPYEEEMRPPRWATCGDCLSCFRANDKGDDPWAFEYDEELRKFLAERRGICIADKDDPIIVDLEMSVFSGKCPCCGDMWEQA